MMCNSGKFLVVQIKGKLQKSNEHLHNFWYFGILFYLIKLLLGFHDAVWFAVLHADQVHVTSDGVRGNEYLRSREMFATNFDFWLCLLNET